MALRTDIIPISYAGGTGGSFLSSFIWYAQIADNSEWQFSESGNAHNLERPYVPGLRNDNMFDDNKKLITALIDAPLQSDVVYVKTHIWDMDLILEHFDKAIKINYSAQDVSDIATCFILKWGFDDKNISETEVKKDREWFAWHLFGKALHRFRPRPELEPRVTNISWKELTTSDPKLLIDKLSKFTNLPVENFQINQLIKWRELTKSCIQRFKNL